MAELELADGGKTNDQHTCSLDKRMFYFETCNFNIMQEPNGLFKNDFKITTTNIITVLQDLLYDHKRVSDPDLFDEMKLLPNHTNILNVRVCECVFMGICLLPVYAQTASPIKMKFGMQVGNHIDYFYWTSNKEGNVPAAITEIQTGGAASNRYL